MELHKPKQDLVTELHTLYKSFSALKTKNEETWLLLGDIAHYLYNMDDTAFYSPAVKNYEEAGKVNPKDYRVGWFLGDHYALSNAPVAAIDNFIKAEKLLPSVQPAEFWNDCAFAMAVANMPSHCIYAMDKVKNISGKEGSFQQQLGETIYKRIVPVDKSQSYDKKELWTADEGKQTTFTSRPLGLKMLVDSTWNLSVYDYQKNQAAVIMKPPTIANKSGREINYTVAVLIKTANDNDKLADYINAFVAKYQDKKNITFSSKYEKMVAYEIKEKTMYPEVGGGHMYMIGIEREAPKYPGLLLEAPAILPEGNSAEVSYYRAGESKDRFKGRIFYAIMLDSCEDIHEQSFSIFKAFFDQMVIE